MNTKINSIEGRWDGQALYGNNYPREYRNKILSFTADLWFDGEILKGNCEDDLTKELLLKPATIEGTYKNGSLHFIKKYPCLIIRDEKNMLKANHLEPSFEIQYSGKMHRELFSRMEYSKGIWDIKASLIDKDGITHHYTIGGKWKMKRVE
jgi:hypothetical protein